MPFAVPTLPARATEAKSTSSEDKDAATSATTEQPKENDNNHSSIPQDSIEPKPFAVPSAPVKKGAMLPPSLPTRDPKDSTSSTTTTTTTSQGEPPQKPRSGGPMPNAPPLKYQKPSWSGYPNQQFSFEVIKNGVVVDRIEAPEKEFMVVGRLPMCDLEMEHPVSVAFFFVRINWRGLVTKTRVSNLKLIIFFFFVFTALKKKTIQSLSRYHAVVQFKSNGECFIYDLNSSHGTKLNKTKIPPGVHVPLKPGDQLRFGESTRIYLFQTDQTLDQEEEERKMVEAMIEKQNRARSQSRQDDEEEEDVRFGW